MRVDGVLWPKPRVVFVAFLGRWATARSIEQAWGRVFSTFTN